MFSYIFIYSTYGRHERNFHQNSSFPRYKKHITSLEQKFHADSKNGLKKVHTILEGPKFRFFLIEVSPEMTIQTFKIVYM